MSDLIEWLGFSPYVHEKAARLKADRVGKDHWKVKGDHGTYGVRYDKRFEETGRLGWFTCSCPSGEMSLSATCSHGLAVIKAVLAEERAAPRPPAPGICQTCGRYNGRPGHRISCSCASMERRSA